MYKTIRRFSIVTATAASALLIQTSAPAQDFQQDQGAQQTTQTRTFQGNIDQLRDGALIIDGTRIAVNRNTEFQQNGQRIRFRELDKGDQVRVQARRSGGTWIADRVTLRTDQDRGQAAGRISLEEFRDERQYGVWQDDEWFELQPEGAMTDRQLEQSIRSELNWSPFVGSENVRVQVRNGVAILTGTVEEWSAHGAATENAFEGGAREVRNFIRVRGFSIQPGQGPTYTARRTGFLEDELELELSDQELKEDIESQLFWSPFVNDDGIRVQVQNGVATLTGRVEEWSGHGAATENAFEGGALAVRNQLRGPASDRVVVGTGRAMPGQAVGRPEAGMERGERRYQRERWQRGDQDRYDRY